MAGTYECLKILAHVFDIKIEKKIKYRETCM